MSTTPLLRLGSRASPLARVQTEGVASRLACCSSIVWVRSGGDEDRERPLDEFPGTGVFTAALHRALAEDRVDAAVHSLKDLPAEEEVGVLLACVPEREDARDALVARDGLRLDALPDGARVGTGSPRRSAELLRARPGLTVVPVRGNVGTRIDRVRRGDLDAVVLALAGLRRLGLEGEVTEALDPDVFLPAAGQGALGITIRAGDSRAESCLAPLRDVRAAAATTAERAALRALGAGCHAPVGSFAQVRDGRLALRVRVLSADGRTALEERGEGALGEAAHVGRRAAAALLAAGAGPLVARA